uniref:Uncharacterized protein n=1 Tax=Anopheles merus TaxID=30066 RepID=A0A182UVW0_ANOME
MYSLDESLPVTLFGPLLGAAVDPFAVDSTMTLVYFGCLEAPGSAPLTPDSSRSGAGRRAGDPPSRADDDDEDVDDTSGDSPSCCCRPPVGAAFMQYPVLPVFGSCWWVVPGPYCICSSYSSCPVDGGRPTTLLIAGGTTAPTTTTSFRLDARRRLVLGGRTVLWLLHLIQQQILRLLFTLTMQCGREERVLCTTVAYDCTHAHPPPFVRKR